MLVGCSAPAVPLANSAGSAAVAPTTERDAVIRAVLQRFAANAETLADHGLLDREPYYVVVEDPDRKIDPPPPGPGSLPGRQFVGVRPDVLQAESNRRDTPIHYIAIGVTIDGTHARVWSGADLVSPNVHGTEARLCCCTAMDHYEKTAGAWRFVARAQELCD
jgi:hypothetical protein